MLYLPAGENTASLRIVPNAEADRKGSMRIWLGLKDFDAPIAVVVDLG
jgi:hypothetical protein